MRIAFASEYSHDRLGPVAATFEAVPHGRQLKLGRNLAPEGTGIVGVVAGRGGAWTVARARRAARPRRAARGRRPARNASRSACAMRHGETGRGGTASGTGGVQEVLGCVVDEQGGRANNGCAAERLFGSVGAHRGPAPHHHRLARGAEAERHHASPSRHDDPGLSRRPRTAQARERADVALRAGGRFLHLTGWRREEVPNLRRQEVDLARRTARLRRTRSRAPQAGGGARCSAAALPARELARRAGVSPQTVVNLRRRIAQGSLGS